MKAVLGRKLGMTQIFDEQGNRVPVTLVEAGPLVVVDVKTPARDGYEAVKYGFMAVKERQLSRPRRGVFAKAKVEPHRYLREVRGPVGDAKPGQLVTVGELFNAGDAVDVIGTSRGRGFAGAIKRHGFSGQRDSHGVSLMHRAVGSIGSSDVARVWPGKRMPGRHGSKRVTVRSLRVARVEAERNLLYLRGATPGIRGSLLVIRSAIKAPKPPKPPKAPAKAPAPVARGKGKA